MAKPKSFHAFTDDAGVYCGTVTKFVVHAKKVEFDYDYVRAGANFTGRFEGEHEGDGSLTGEWADESGNQHWKGTATLKATDPDRHYHLHGTWAQTGSSNAGRWVVDAAK